MTNMRPADSSGMRTVLLISVIQLLGLPKRTQLRMLSSHIAFRTENPNRGVSYEFAHTTTTRGDGTESSRLLTFAK